MNDAYLELTKTIKEYPFNIIIHKAYKRKNIVAHYHNDLELSAVFHGPIEFINDTKHIIKNTGGINITNSNEIHYSYPIQYPKENIATGITIQIRYPFLKRIIPSYDHISFKTTSTNEKQIYDLMYQIYKQYNSNDDSLTMVTIFTYILNIISILITSSIQKEMSPNNPIIIDVIQYINMHYQEDLHLYEIANKFNFSREYLARLFKKHVGCSMKQYITRYRINCSMELLQKNLTLSSIAQEVGFSNENQFIQAFKHIHKTTPGQYRKSHFNDN